MYGLCHLHSSLSAGARRSSALHRRVSHRWMLGRNNGWSLLFGATWRSCQTDARAPASSAPDVRQQPSSWAQGMPGRRCACAGPCRGSCGRPIASATVLLARIARGSENIQFRDAGQFTRCFLQGKCNFGARILRLGNSGAIGICPRLSEFPQRCGATCGKCSVWKMPFATCVANAQGKRRGALAFATCVANPQAR